VNLSELGHLVIATTTRLDKALALAKEADFDMAFLDINLAGSSSFQVADILRKREIPFIFTIGYGVDGLIDGHRSAHLLTKPIGIKELKNMTAKAGSETSHGHSG
jgi:CheY-like chemotaxis protein